MPPAAKKQAVVVLFDLKTRDREAAVRILEDILAIGRFSNTAKDVCRIVRLHCNEFEEDYKCIDVPSYDDSLLDPFLAEEYITNAEPTKDNANWLQGIQVASKVMARMVAENPKGKARRHIIFITDLSTPLPEETDTDEWISLLKEEFENNSAFLYILGPDVRVKDTVTYPNSDRWACMDSAHLPEGTIAANIGIAKTLLEAVPGVMCNFDIAIDMYSFSQCFYPRQVQNDFLAIGDGKIPCVVYSHYIKKGPHITFKGTKATLRSEWVSKHNVEEQIAFDNVTSGIKLHGKFLEMTNNLNDSFKTRPPKTFQILGFTQRSQIPEYLIGKESTSKVTCSYENSETFGALLDVLIRDDKVAIVQRNYRKGLENKLHLLIPDDDRTFALANLPFADDIKKVVVEGELADLNEDGVLPSEEERNAIYAFLERRDVVERKGALKLDVNLKLQPTNKIIYQRLKNKHLGRDMEDNLTPASEILRIFDDIEDEPDVILIPPVVIS